MYYKDINCGLFAKVTEENLDDVIAFAKAFAEKTGAVIAITGILGNMLCVPLCKLFKITHPIAQGVALGTSAHVMGTAKARELSELTGAVSSLSLTVAGIFTAILYPLITLI